jgi:hypothetical protein
MTDGLPVTGMKSHRLYAARRAVEAEHHMVYAENFAANPDTYMTFVATIRDHGMTSKQTSIYTGEFMAAFFAFGPAVELMKTVGRIVSVSKKYSLCYSYDLVKETDHL